MYITFMENGDNVLFFVGTIIFLFLSTLGFQMFLGEKIYLSFTFYINGIKIFLYRLRSIFLSIVRVVCDDI
jgi:hypothetical protein